MQNTPKTENFYVWAAPFSVASSVFDESEEATGNERQKTALFPVGYSLLVKSEEVTGNERKNAPKLRSVWIKTASTNGAFGSVWTEMLHFQSPFGSKRRLKTEHCHEFKRSD